MRYILYTSILFGGGAERVLCELANNLSEENNVLLIASYRNKMEYYTNSRVRKLYIDSEIEKKNSIKQIVRLRKIVKEFKADAVISFLPFPNFKMLLATLGLKTKKIVSVRNDPHQEYPTIGMKYLAFILYSFADGIVFQTKEAQHFFPNKIKNKSEIIMNQVDKKFFNTARTSEEYYIATGRLNSQKNYKMMIKAFAHFVENFPTEKLYIYGEGEEKKHLQELIKKYNVEQNIYLQGATSDIPEVLSHAKVFILTSNFEGMPNGLLEAMAVGLPCIATDCPAGGPKEIIKNNYNGILIPVGDETKLYEELCYIQSHEEDRNKIGYNAKESAKRFEPEKIFDKWNSYIEKIVQIGKNK